MFFNSIYKSTAYLHLTLIQFSNLYFFLCECSISNCPYSFYSHSSIIISIDNYTFQINYVQINYRTSLYRLYFSIVNTLGQFLFFIQEIARKKAQGIRVTEDGDEVSDKGDGGDEYDPFAPNMDEFTMSDSKAVSWSYSKYMEALDGEEVLNEVDNNTFTDLSKISGEYITDYRMLT